MAVPDDGLVMDGVRRGCGPVRRRTGRRKEQGSQADGGGDCVDLSRFLHLSTLSLMKTPAAGQNERAGPDAGFHPLPLGGFALRDLLFSRTSLQISILSQPFSSLVDVLPGEHSGREGDLLFNGLPPKDFQGGLHGLPSSGRIFEAGGQDPLSNIDLPLVRQTVDADEQDARFPSGGLGRQVGSVSYARKPGLSCRTGPERIPFPPAPGVPAISCPPRR